MCSVAKGERTHADRGSGHDVRACISVVGLARMRSDSHGGPAVIERLAR